MIGLRGASRYTHPSYAEAFALECRAMRRVREDMGLTNVELMVPFCRRVAEGERAAGTQPRSGVGRGRPASARACSSDPSIDRRWCDGNGIARSGGGRWPRLDPPAVSMEVGVSAGDRRRTSAALALCLALMAACATTSTVPDAHGCRTRCELSGPDGAGCGPCPAASDADHSLNVATRNAYDFERALEPLSRIVDGPELERQACALAPLLRDRARALSEGPVPSAYRFQDYEWAAQTDRLLARADELLTICTTPRVPTVSDVVGSVRTAFRSLAARLGVVAPARR